MAELKIEVFTSPTCPHCPAAVRATRELLAKYPGLEGRVKWSEVSTATSRGRKRAQSYEIRGVPTIILTNEAGEKGGITGAPGPDKYVKIVYEMLGEDPPETDAPSKEKHGLFARIFG